MKVTHIYSDGNPEDLEYCIRGILYILNLPDRSKKNPEPKPAEVSPRVPAPKEVTR